ncbi:MAG: diguanylate cyclase domain-containing protein [Pseudomonadota bacterium]
METGHDHPRDYEAGIDAEIDAVAAERQRSRYGLRFAEPLEQAYQNDQRHRAMLAFRHTAVFILLLYVLLSSGIYALMPAHEVDRWLSLYGWAGVIILAAQALSYVSAFERWFPLYIGAGSFLAVALSVAVTGVVRDPVAGPLTHAGIMYAMVIIYGICGLRFRHALVAGWAGGLAGDLLATALGGSIDWGVLHRTYTGSSLLGMFLVYYAELRDRESFLQTRLLELGHLRVSEYARRVEQLSREDPLTGLMNRRHFGEVLENEWRRAQRSRRPVALLLIDIDNFKHYNDTLGHPAGDRCLIRVADILATHARRSGDTAVRFGGEEFLLFVPDAGEEEAARHAAQLHAAISEACIPHAPGLDRRIITVSVGAAVVTPGESFSPEDLIQAADQALYRVKHGGRNGWQLISLLPSTQAANEAEHEGGGISRVRILRGNPHRPPPG